MKRKIILILTSIIVIVFLSAAAAYSIGSFDNEPQDEKEIINAVLEKFSNKVDEKLKKDNLVKIYQLEYDVCDLDKTAENISKATRLKDVLSDEYSWIVFFKRSETIPAYTLMTDIVICSVSKGMTVSEYEAACKHYGAEIDETLKSSLAEDEGKWTTSAMRSTTEFELKMLDKKEAYKLFKEKGVTPVNNGNKIVVVSSPLLTATKFICTQAKDGKEYVIANAPGFYSDYIKAGEIYELTDFFQRVKQCYEDNKAVVSAEGTEVYGGVY